MSLRFSLLGLVGLLSFAALACAALVRPGPQWLSVVVTLTAAMIGYQVLRAVLESGASRAAAIGWLVFALAYLALTLAPWLADQVGPKLLSSRALAYAQTSWRRESTETHAGDYLGRINVNQPFAPTILDGTSNTLVWSLDVNASGSGWGYQPTGNLAYDGSTASVNGFRLSGQWLFAWVAGWLGSAIAVALERRAARHSPQ
jgi:hypothetical protein